MKNIADILRNAPEGIELYSTAFGVCKLSYVIENEITIEYFDGKNPDFVTLDQDGKFMPNGSCILFPANSTDSWVYWQEHLFRKYESIGYVIINTHLECFWIIGEHDRSMCLYDSAGGHISLRDGNLSNCRYATKEEAVKFFEKVGENNCHWDIEAKAILENTKKEEFIEEPKNNSKFSEPDQKLTEIELDETPDGVVCMPRVLDDQVQTITEGIAPKVSINSRFAKVEPSDLTPIEELDETPIPCYEPKYFSCTGNCGYCVYHTTTGCSRKIEYDKSGCVSPTWSITHSSNCTNKYIPKLKVGDKACLSDKDDNFYFEEILKANDEEYYTKTFGWINCKTIDEIHEINFKEYNKPFTIGDFKPFDKVLWRLGPTDIWSIGFFDNYYIAGENDKVNYSVVGYEKNWVPQCVPYNIDTAYLHDTDKEYDGKYKTW